MTSVVPKKPIESMLGFIRRKTNRDGEALKGHGFICAEVAKKCRGLSPRGTLSTKPNQATGPFDQGVTPRPASNCLPPHKPIREAFRKPAPNKQPDRLIASLARFRTCPNHMGVCHPQSDHWHAPFLGRVLWPDFGNGQPDASVRLARFTARWIDSETLADLSVLIELS